MSVQSGSAEQSPEQSPTASQQQSNPLSSAKAEIDSALATLPSAACAYAKNLAIKHIRLVHRIHEVDNKIARLSAEGFIPRSCRIGFELTGSKGLTGTPEFTEALASVEAAKSQAQKAFAQAVLRVTELEKSNLVQAKSLVALDLTLFLTQALALAQGLVTELTLQSQQSALLLTTVADRLRSTDPNVLAGLSNTAISTRIASRSVALVDMPILPSDATVIVEDTLKIAFNLLVAPAITYSNEVRQRKVDHTIARLALR